MNTSKKIASELGWEECIIKEMSPSGITFVLDMICRRDRAEKRLLSRLDDERSEKPRADAEQELAGN